MKYLSLFSGIGGFEIGIVDNLLVSAADGAKIYGTDNQLT